MNEPSADGSLPTNKPGHRDKTGGKRAGDCGIRSGPRPLSKDRPQSRDREYEPSV